MLTADDVSDEQLPNDLADRFLTDRANYQGIAFGDGDDVALAAGSKYALHLMLRLSIASDDDGDVQIGGRDCRRALHDAGRSRRRYPPSAAGCRAFRR